MRKTLIFLVLFFTVIVLFAQTTREVSKPIQITDNVRYERGGDLTYGNGYYWLVYSLSYLVGGDDPDFEVYGATGVCDHSDYRMYYKKATTIQGLASALPIQLMYDSNPAFDQISNGNAWIEYYDNKIFILGAEVNATYGHNMKLFWTDDDGDTWNKVDNISPYAQQGDLAVFNGELWYTYWSTVEVPSSNGSIHTNNPTNRQSWLDASDSESDDYNFEPWFSIFATTCRFSVDNTDPNSANHQLYVIGCNWTSGAEGVVSLYDPDQVPGSRWLTPNSIEYNAWDPAMTKYNDQFIYLQAPEGDTGQQSYQYCHETSVSNLSAANYTMFDASAYNTDPDAFNENVWNCCWAQVIIDLYGASPTGNTMVIYNSERNDSDPINPINANMYLTEMNWNLENNHYTFINTAINGNKVFDGFSFAAAAADDIINVISGTYTEDVVIGVDLILQGNESSIIDGDVTVTGDNATVNGFEITGTLDFQGSGIVYASYNYWGNVPVVGTDITGGGDVRYIPYYTDAAMTTLAPELAVSISRTATQTTLTWSPVGLHDYTVYGSDDPDADFPGRAWVEIAVVTSGTAFTSSYQFYAVVTEDWYEGATIVGYYEYVLVQGYNYIPISMDYGYDNVMDMVTDFSIVDGQALSIWNEITQTWGSAVLTSGVWDPELGIGISIGDVVVFNTSTTPETTLYTEYPAGQLPDDWASFDLTITGTTDMNLIYLPLDMADLTTLGDVAASIGSQNANTISIWDETNQAWITAAYISYYDAWTYSSTPVSVGQAMMVGAVQNFTWPIR